MGKRVLSMLTALCLALSLCPAAALAEEETVPEPPEISTANPPEAPAEDPADEAPATAESGEPVSAPLLAAVSGTCGDNLTWTLDDQGVLTISGTGSMINYTSVAASDSDLHINTLAPWQNRKVLEVIISDGITRIGDNSFAYCTNLASASIPNSVTSIGNSAFRDCTSLTSVTIPDSVTSIGDYAFRNCRSLTSVTIPNSVTSIGYRAFSSCSSLTSVTIPNSVTSIGDYAFYNCSSLTSVTIPSSVTSIGDSAFASCSSLTSMSIPDSVTNIGNREFYNCSSLTNISVDEGNNKYCSVDGVLFNKDKTKLVCYPGGKEGAYNIPNSVTSIGAGAFWGCSSLTSVTIPNSVTSIGELAFWGCSSLTGVTIPDSVTSIGYWAFEYCSSLTSVTIPNSVTSIGAGAFIWCSSLTDVTIPNSVTSIGSSAFYGCDALETVYYSGSESEWDAISIGTYNDPLRSANIIYNSTDAENSTIVASGTCGNNVTWTLDDAGTLTVSGSGEMKDYSFPESVNLVHQSKYPPV